MSPSCNTNPTPNPNPNALADSHTWQAKLQAEFDEMIAQRRVNSLGFVEACEEVDLGLMRDIQQLTIMMIDIIMSSRGL